MRAPAAVQRLPNPFEDLMAVPKRRTSKSRKRLRRGHHAAASVRPQACPRCSSPKLAHRVCDSCGYYGGKKVVEVEDS
jgi:large subunit ribosomal protein L32